MRTTPHNVKVVVSPALGDPSVESQLLQAVLVEARTALPKSSCLLVGPMDRADRKGEVYTSRPVVPKLAAIQRKKDKKEKKEKKPLIQEVEEVAEAEEESDSESERARKKAEKKAKKAAKEVASATIEDLDAKAAAALGMELEKYKKRLAQGKITIGADGLPKKEKKHKSEKSQDVPDVAGKKRKLEENTEKSEKKKKKSKS